MKVVCQRIKVAVTVDQSSLKADQNSLDANESSLDISWDTNISKLDMDASLNMYESK